MPRLRRDTADVVIVPEEQHRQKSKRQRDEHPLYAQLPERNHPVISSRREERLRDGQFDNVGALQSSWDVGKAGPEEGGDRVGVVGEDFADPGLEGLGCCFLLFEGVDGQEEEDGDDDVEVAFRFTFVEEGD